MTLRTEEGCCGYAATVGYMTTTNISRKRRSFDFSPEKLPDWFPLLHNSTLM